MNFKNNCEDNTYLPISQPYFNIKKFEGLLFPIMIYTVVGHEISKTTSKCD